MRVFNYFLFAILGIAIGWFAGSAKQSQYNHERELDHMLEVQEILNDYQDLINVIYENQPSIIEDWLCETPQWEYLDETYGWNYLETSDEEEYDYGYED